MVFFEAIQALLSLDLGFFVELTLNNLAWVFFFGALVYFFYEDKRTKYFFVVLTITLLAFVDFEVITGLTWSAAGFLLIHYLSKLVLVDLTQSNPALKKHTVVITELAFFSLLLYYTFFLK